jgi:TolB-like protein/Tfp pilus assembly protein PilF
LPVSTPANIGALSHAAIRQQLERILASPGFAGAARMSQLLRWTVEKTLIGQEDAIKEYTLGVEVFERKETFDPKTDSIVRVTASKLRLKLRDYYATAGAGDPLIIELPPGGYVPRFHECAAPTEPPATRRQTGFRSFRMLLALTGLVALLSLAVYLIGRERGTGGASGGIQSLAVLPFVNMSAAQEDLYLSDALTEEIIDALTRRPNLKLVARTSSFQFKGKAVDVRDVGKRLGVEAVLEGSVQRVGDRVRVTAQLNNTADGYHVWSRVYDRKATDLLELQRDIAQAVAGNFPLGKASPVNPAAYERYLRGRHFMRQFSLDKLPETVALFQEAVAIDPGFALAYGGIADAYFAMAATAAAVSPDTVLPKVRYYALRAAELDPLSFDAHVSVGRLRELEWNWAAALRAYERAIELAPGAERPHRRYGDLLCKLGRSETGLKELRLALELDPLSANGGAMLSMALYWSGQFDAARERALNTIHLHPGHSASQYQLALSYVGLGQYEKALKSFEEAIRLSREKDDSATASSIAHAYAASGRTREARKILSQLLRRRTNEYVSRVALARIYAGLDDGEQVIGQLQKGYAEHDSLMATVRADPRFKLVRADPRYLKILRDMNM